ncbi:PREDICTED: LOC109949536 isoform X1 [Prunus dulcis]|uniref:PREDICTED: LOC109949536 isoform X1 n=1 Tax=Prunus dulcis TaxID=3755 RepID=A0A5E4G1E9_PRUDU|nr:PREDICTED: LOC109949536 isoform X1 [Prunus dulcis]
MVDDDDVHQQPANPSCLRINSTINSFFMTCHAGIRDTNLEGYEEKFTHKKIYVALQATLEQVTKLTNKVAEMRSANEKVIEDFKSSKEIGVLSETMTGGADEGGTSLT